MKYLKWCNYVVKKKNELAMQQVWDFFLVKLWHGFCIEKKATETTKEKKSNGTIDENSNSSIISIDGKDNSESLKEDTSPKRNAKRTVKGKVVKYGTDEEDDDDENQENFHSDQSDYVGSDSDSEKIIKKAKPKAKAQVNSTRFCLKSISAVSSHLKRKMRWMFLCKIDKIKMIIKRKKQRNLE